ncbi:DUF2218 domain-containing protein [Ensifer sp.]|jgi:hypothetical protein|uniref:DUF2218 domain-containing protein n=1 Tax=Ensifer sp. TaxID=1872086 RepID=UPI002E138598|nr:DUF2218 domain-containing protein [Ensifer sp.]
MGKAESGFTTERASRYLQQMSKHFAHKVTVEYSETDSVIVFSGGITARMAARGDRLSFVVEAADAEGLEEGKGIVESHIIRFAFREELQSLDCTASAA